MKATIKDGTIHLEGTGSEIAGVLATLVEDPESCSLTGRSCDTCTHQGACYGCGVHYAHWEPAELEQQARCPKCGGVADGVCKCEPEPVQLKETHLEETNSTRRCLDCGDMTKYRIVGTDDYLCTVCVPRSDWLTIWRDSHFNRQEKPKPERNFRAVKRRIKGEG